MEKLKMLALSTVHVSEDTAKLIDNGDTEVVIYAKEKYGWFVHVPELCNMNNLENGKCPSDLYRCILFARKNDCDWLMFDRDVEPIDELPQYNWDT